jgi:DNA-3-methyladenine glycosylase II
MGRIQFSLNPAPPFRLDLTAWAIRRRPENEIDLWDGKTYRRVLIVQGEPTLINVTQTGGVDAPRLDVTVSCLNECAQAKTVIAARLELLLGLRIDLTAFYKLAANQPRLHELSNRFRGLKPPRFPTLWEGIVNGIACQQFSLTVAIMLLNRLSAAYGLPFDEPNGRQYALPRPEDLAAASLTGVRSLGFSGAKSRALIELGQIISDGRFDPGALADLDNRQAISRLKELRGVGRWTAEYALLRGLGRIDLFPGDDVGARKNLERWMRLRKPLDYERVGRITSRWKPYRGLIYFHLLLDGLARGGYLAEELEAVNRLPERRYRDDQTETGLRHSNIR